MSSLEELSEAEIIKKIELADNNQRRVLEAELEKRTLQVLNKLKSNLEKIGDGLDSTADNLGNANSHLDNLRQELARLGYSLNSASRTSQALMRIYVIATVGLTLFAAAQVVVAVLNYLSNLSTG